MIHFDVSMFHDLYAALPWSRAGYQPGGQDGVPQLSGMSMAGASGRHGYRISGERPDETQNDGE
ncbi:hypothetical protein QF56_002403 [Salmonella enterica subsp. enterica]|nr:hypothetical protein [Salmonella enterica subsp. enterica serovar Miami]